MIRMRNDRVLVKRIPLPTQTKGGIILPLRAVELPQLARIISIGTKNPDNLQPNDLVLLKKYEGHLFVLNNEDHYILHVEDILALITE